MKLGNIVLIVLFFYILVVTFLIDYFINKLSAKQELEASHNKTIGDIPFDDKHK